MSTLLTDASHAYALASNISTIFSNLGFVYADETYTTASASTFTAAFSQTVADASNAYALASNVSAMFSNIGFTYSDELQTAPSDSTFTNVFSQFVANFSNLEADVSDIRLADATWDTKYASDGWANVSDLRVSISDLAALIFNSFD
jgi:N-acetylglutamate synthase-like GNAT family acetyltransferase